MQVSPPSRGAVAVYDLLVEDDHEFFANDILVANCLMWLEEMAAWRYMQEAFDQMRFGLRVGPKPRWICSTTPKPRPLIKKLLMGHYRDVAVTSATMYENPYLPAHIREALEEAYGSTSLGGQELYGRLIEQDEGALWTREVIEKNRLVTAPDLLKIEVGVDPSGGAGEQGIIVVGMGQSLTETAPTVTESGLVIPAPPPKVVKHGYTLDDRTVRLKPSGWGKAAVQAAMDWSADCIVVETNFGGDMAVSNLNTAAEDLGVAIPIKTVHAARGKAPRAQPVSALATQGRWHHVGVFEELEDQLCTWVPNESDWSPDRIDGMVWPAWHMRLVSAIVRGVGTFGGMDVVRRTIGRRRSA